MKIGIQGEKGSNAEEAALKYIKKNNISDYELVYLVTSENVVKSLKAGAADLGALAFRNKIAGEVRETSQALDGVRYENMDEIRVKVIHSLFVRGDYEGEIKHIASHEQALAQTRKMRKKYFPSSDETEEEDTGKAARDLAESKLSKDTGVLCRKNAGEMYGLKMLKENMNDEKDNYTEFHIIRLK